MAKCFVWVTGLREIKRETKCQQIDVLEVLRDKTGQQLSLNKGHHKCNWKQNDCLDFEILMNA